MESKQDVIRSYFDKLGLEPAIADIYLCLYTQGPQTISQLARNSGIERTKIYRILDDLKESALFELETIYKSHLLKAGQLQNIQMLLAKREQTLSELQAELPSIENLLLGNKIQNQGTRIQFYRGIEGVKQLIWNETKARGEALTILHDNMQVNTAEKFFDRWVKRCNDQNIKHRSIVNDRFIESQNAWYETHINDRLKNWEGRRIEQSAFDINHSTVVYNDVVAYFDWQDGELFAIEIYNQAIADAQRHFFEMLWSQSKSLPS